MASTLRHPIIDAPAQRRISNSQTSIDEGDVLERKNTSSMSTTGSPSELRQRLQRSATHQRFVLTDPVALRYALIHMRFAGSDSFKIS